MTIREVKAVYKIKLETAKEIKKEIERYTSLSLEETIDIINDKIKFYDGFTK